MQLKEVGHIIYDWFQAVLNSIHDKVDIYMLNNNLLLLLIRI